MSSRLWPVAALLFFAAWLLASCGSVTTAADVDAGGGRLEVGNTGAAGDAAADDKQTNKPDALEAAAAACGGVAPWMVGMVYAAGDRAQNAGQVYQCLHFPNSNWCGLADYAPGKGFAWNDAWTLVGPCP